MNVIEDINDEVDNRRLALTQQVRENIINELMNKGIPEDKNNQNFLIKALDGLDRTILSKSKLKIEDRYLQNQKDTSKIIADILSKHTVMPLINKDGIPELPSDIEVTDMVEGETLIGVTNITYANLIK